MPVFQECQQIATVLGAQGRQAPVIQLPVGHKYSFMENHGA
jgi:hypothetical protein